jgi:endonuclease/exonuclease/phosphatase family metal-dependent hydrolase
MSFRLALVTALTAGMALVAAACGGDDDITIMHPATSTPAPPVETPTPDAAAAPTEFRVAYITLMSPISLDATNTTASDTFEARLTIVIDELKEFKPDLVAFSEATKTDAHGSVEDRLVKELKLESVYIAAKPWYVGLTKDQNAEIAKQVGFQEGELVLVRSDRFPVLGYEKMWLNPRTSEAEGPGAIHLKIKGPPAVGDFDVFVSHLTGVDARIRAQQATSFAQFIKAKKGSGPTIALGDFGDPAGSATQQAFMDIGLSDVLDQSGLQTCCRETVTGEQPPVTTRTDYILASQWMPSALGLFAAEAKQQDGGTQLYASDHNGVTAVFPIGAAPGP